MSCLPMKNTEQSETVKFLPRYIERCGGVSVDKKDMV